MRAVAISNLSASYLRDEEAAYAFLEDVLWPSGPVCPYCGGMDRITKVKGNPEKRIRLGLHRYVAEFEFRYNNRSALGVGDEGQA